MTFPAQMERGEHGKEVGKTACAEGATDWVMDEDFDFKKLANADKVAGHFDVCLGCRLDFLPSNIRQCDLILVEHHSLHSARLVGEQLRYAVILEKVNGWRLRLGALSGSRLGPDVCNDSKP